MVLKLPELSARNEDSSVSFLVYGLMNPGHDSSLLLESENYPSLGFCSGGMVD